MRFFCLNILVMAMAACGSDSSVGAMDAGADANAPVDAGHAIMDAGVDDANDASVAHDAMPDAQDAGTPMAIEAWIFPGDPACNAPAEYSDGRHIDVLKPEYYDVGADGELVQLVVATDGCNAFSAANAADVKAHSTQQLVTVSAGAVEMGAMVGDATKRAKALTTLVGFVDTIGLSGIDIDFEGAWNEGEYKGYLSFITDLGNALHAKGHILEIDTTAFANANDQAGDLFKYEDIAPLPIDRIVVMAYDYMTDYGPGAGAPIAPNTWVSSVIDWAMAKVGDPSRVVIGIPSYGYSGPTGSTNVNRRPYAEFAALAGFASATTLPDSFEKSWAAGGMSYVFVDTEGLDAKRAFIASKGVQAISVWHLGGNQWFSH